MTDVTLTFERYRLAAGSLWNGHFWMPGEANWHDRDRFERVKRVLFDTLISCSAGGRVAV
jgi:hypothetical protein